MYRIIKTDGTELGVTEKVLYIELSEDGCFVPADSEEKAIGVAFHSIAYNLLGHQEIDGAETVLVSETDGGDTLFDTAKMALDSAELLVRMQYEADVASVGGVK